MCGIVGILPIGKPITIIVYCTSLIYLICNLIKKLYFLGIVQNIDIIKVTTKEEKNNWINFVFAKILTCESFAFVKM